MATTALIINNKNEYFKYEIDTTLDTGDYRKAVDEYIKDKFTYEDSFAITEKLWQKIKEEISDLDTYIGFANGFIKKDRYKIKEVLTISRQQYPEET
jgi:hypothetical protein